MYDEESVRYVRRTESIHYGSLEEQEKKRIARGGSVNAGSLAIDAIQAGISAGNINITGKDGMHHQWASFWSIPLSSLFCFTFNLLFETTLGAFSQ